MARQVFLERPPTISDEQIDELENLIRKKFDLKTGFGEPHQEAAALVQTFKGFDLVQHDGTITASAFLNAMRKLNCCTDEHVLMALFDRYDKHDRGVLDVKELCYGLFGVKKVPKASPACRNALKLVTDQVLARGGKNGIRTLTRILRMMDDNGNRKLEKIELDEGLRHYGVDLSKDELDTVFHFFDSNNTGTISITEFLVGIRGKMPQQRADIVRKAFTRLDKDADRKTTINDLLRIYNVTEHPDVLTGVKTPEEVMRDFASDWDRNGDDVITEDEFLDYYKDLSAGIDDDRYFELMVRNAWKLAGGSGWAENTANRRVCVTHIDGTQTIECLIDDIGLGDDVAKIKTQLRKQGVKDILRVHIN
ncbi:Crustacean calcium-binding protein 23 [Diplonema papillatum]|nr:Crustacean calcium-binding protein 23 [Diplonema papillatum]